MRLLPLCAPLLLLAASCPALAADYTLGADSMEHDDVPKGKVTK